MNGFQTLGVVEGLIPASQTTFRYPEEAVLTPVLSDGTSDFNVVLQSSGHSARRAALAWAPVPEDDMEIIRGYSEEKDQVSFIDVDGSARTVFLMDFDASLLAAGAYTVNATLVEIAPPEGS